MNRMQSSENQTLSALRRLRAKIEELERERSEPIAVVGAGCRLAGPGQGPEAFWRAISEGTDLTSDVPVDRWDMDEYYDVDPRVPGKMYTRRGGFMANVDMFDAAFFEISPRETMTLDPQQRLLLEVGWEAIENSGYSPKALSGSLTGVFTGISAADYAFLLARRDSPESIDGYFGTGTSHSVAAGRLSYFLGLQGPCVAVDTACSSSLIAVHLACNALRRGECNLALASGINLLLSPESSVSCCKARMLATDGRCKTFDAAANGYSRAEGAVTLVLKRVSDAVRDEDRILAILRGSATNQDGPSGGLTVPNGPAQQAVIRAALHNAQVEISDVGYVEAHGTGTSLGDPIEAQALGEVFRNPRGRTRRVAVGSVKTNVGHHEAGAGMVGLLKTILCLEHQELVPQLHLNEVNQHISLSDDPLLLLTERRPWPAGKGPRIAGVSAFAFQGSNAHVVVEEAAVEARAEPRPRPWHVLCVSARSEAALQSLAERHLQHLARRPSLNVQDVCFTANAGRAHFSHRRAVIGRGMDEVRAGLAAIVRGEKEPGVVAGHVNAGTPAVAFLFTGQGAQYAGMGRQLYESEPVVRRVLQECEAAARPVLGRSLLEVMYGADEALINETEYAQPALFALECATAAMWRAWGVEPTAVVGHSIGEYAAACVAGVFSLEQGMRLVVERGRRMQALPRIGAMVALNANEARIREVMERTGGVVAIAAVNGPASTVISGERDAVRAVVEQLAQQGVQGQELRVSHAFHSPLMAPMAADFEAVARGVEYRTPRLMMAANVTGEVLRSGQTLDASYWGRQITAPVRFADSVQALAAEGYGVWVEMGPQPTLSLLGEQAVGAGSWIGTLQRGREDWQQVTKGLAALYVQGVKVDWSAVERGHGRRVALPTYPFERQRHWYESRRDARSRPATKGLRSEARTLDSHPLLGPPQQGQQNELEFTRRIEIDSPGFLSDHDVHGTIVFPATAYIDMVASAAADAFQATAIDLEDLRIERALVVTEKAPRDIRLVFSPVDEHTAECEISSRSIQADEADDWMVHARCRARRGEGAAQAARPVDEARERLLETVSQAEHYAALRDLGLNFGPSFRTVESVWHSATPGEAIGRIDASHIPAETLQEYLVHPAILDGCLQVITEAAGKKQLFLPVAITRMRLHRPFPIHGWCHVKLPNAGSEQGVLTADLSVTDETGQPVAEIEGMRFIGTDREAFLQATSGVAAAAFYALDWQRAANPPQPVAPAHRPPSRWLVLGDVAGLAPELSRLLDAEGENVIATHAADRRSSDGTADLSGPTVEEEWIGELVRSMPVDQAVRCNIVVLWSLEASPLEQADACSLDAGQQDSCGRLLRLAQAVLRESKFRTAFRFWVVTRGAQPVTDEQTHIAVTQAPVWGLTRVLRMEHSDLWCRSVDLSPEATGPSEAAALLLDELKNEGTEDEVAWRNGVRYVPRIAQWQPSVSPGVRLERPSAPSYQLASANPGFLDRLQLRATARRTPGHGEVEIEVACASLNFRDVLSALDRYPGGPAPLGSECAGTVVGIGPGVEHLSIGTEVVAMSAGTIARYITTDAALVVRKPPKLTAVEAASVPIVFLTSLYAFRWAGLGRGDRVLIHSAMGGVGMAAVQLAQRAGAEVFATAGSPEKRAALRLNGVPHVLDSRTLDFADEIMRATNGEGVDVVLNALPGDFARKSLAILRSGGRFIEIGKTDLLDPSDVPADRKYLRLDLGDVMASEPHTVCAMLEEVYQAFDAKELVSLPITVFPVEDSVAAFRMMAQGRHTGKIVLSLTASSSPAQGRGAALRGDGTYLVTGGTGGLGLAVADWMSRSGAGNLVLMSRRGEDAVDAAALDTIRANGARVTVARGDVADVADVRRILDEIGASMPELRGVVHAAGLVDDGVLASMDWARFSRVQRPKVAGAWALHTSLGQAPLDFFVMFSSVTSMLGTKGQANYAAANAFLDALASARSRSGLPTVSIQWGPWADIGMAARLVSESEFRSRGHRSLLPEEGLRALETILSSPLRDSVAVMAVDWQRVGSVSGGRGVAPKLSSMIRAMPARPGKRGEAGGGALRKALSDASPELRREVAVKGVQAHLRAVLGLQQDHRIALDQRLKELGVDSLMSLEFRNRLGDDLGSSLSSTLTMEYPTVEALVNYIVQDDAAPAGLPDTDKLSLVVPIQPTGSRPPLFLVHPVGGGVFCYEPLAQEFGPEQPVYGLRAPGLDSGEQPERSIEALADRYVKNIRKLRKNGPYALGGWSMGALIAIEMARRLRAASEDVSVLLLVDPVHGGHEISEATKIALLRNLFGADTQADQSFDSMERILEYATQSLGAEQVTRSLNVFKHHLDAIQNYRGDPYSGVATAFHAEVPVEEGGPDAFRRLCPNAEMITLSGDHFGVLRPPILQQLADHFRRLLQA